MFSHVFTCVLDTNVGIQNVSENARKLANVRKYFYTAQTGLPYFYRVAVIAIGSWYYVSASKPMGAKHCFRYRSVNIGPSYK